MSHSTQNEIENILNTVNLMKDIKTQVKKIIVGQEEVIDLLILSLLCEGHVLLEGVPGLGKTVMVKTLSQSMNLLFSRIQFTPDLMPADIIGTSIAVSENNRYSLEFEKGPVFGNIILADEINRASPKTQSALLEAMQEQSVTVRGKKHDLPRPFHVLATQNPLEMEGTYPLPEAQIDRFLFKIIVKNLSESEIETVIERTSGSKVTEISAIMDKEKMLFLGKAVRDVVVPPVVSNYTARLILATQPESDISISKVKKYVRYGTGPRGAQALILASKAKALLEGRFNISIDDIISLVKPALRHRIGLNFEGLSDNVSVDDLLTEIVDKLPKDQTKNNAFINDNDSLLSKINSKNKK